MVDLSKQSCLLTYYGHIRLGSILKLAVIGSHNNERMYQQTNFSVRMTSLIVEDSVGFPHSQTAWKKVRCI